MPPRSRALLPAGETMGGSERTERRLAMDANTGEGRAVNAAKKPQATGRGWGVAGRKAGYGFSGEAASGCRDEGGQRPVCEVAKATGGRREELGSWEQMQVRLDKMRMYKVGWAVLVGLGYV